MKYIATFYSHFFALKFSKEMKGIKNATLMPSPRELTTSCGTCCAFECENVDELIIDYNEVEKICQMK
ncbi:MAG: DUF3343 domain-containing protein [Eubacteriales bacterium]|nr:DUF3343 domain-containing protein [Eubacteriales bacterium]